MILFVTVILPPAPWCKQFLVLDSKEFVSAQEPVFLTKSNLKKLSPGTALVEKGY